MTIVPETCPEEIPNFNECERKRGEAPWDTRFVDATGQGALVPDPLPLEAVGGSGVIGWTGPDEVVVLDDVTQRSSVDDEVDNPEPAWVSAVPLDGGSPRRLSELPGQGLHRRRHRHPRADQGHEPARTTRPATCYSTPYAPQPSAPTHC